MRTQQPKPQPWTPLQTTILACCVLPTVGCVHDSPRTERVSARLLSKSVGILQDGLEQGQSWQKVHAAEFMISLGYTQPVRAAFERELAVRGEEPRYRIGIWRVLAQSDCTADKRESWKQRILDVLLDRSAPDRVHAAESLAKLHLRLPSSAQQVTMEAAEASDWHFAAMATWLLAENGVPAAERKFAAFFLSSNMDLRRLAAYACPLRQELPASTRDGLLRAARAEAWDSSIRAYLLAAGLVYAQTFLDRGWFREELVEYLRTGSEAEQCQATSAFAKVGDPEDIPSILPLLDSKPMDVRLGAANAILQIARRTLRQQAAPCSSVTPQCQ